MIKDGLSNERRFAEIRCLLELSVLKVAALQKYEPIKMGISKCRTFKIHVLTYAFS